MQAAPADAADDAPRAAMMAAPRFCTVGMKSPVSHLEKKKGRRRGAREWVFVKIVAGRMRDVLGVVGDGINGFLACNKGEKMKTEPKVQQFEGE